MFLPLRALKLISEYSKPLTRPDWRNIRRIKNMGHIYNDIMNNKNNYYPPVFKLFTKNIVRNYSYRYIMDIVILKGKEYASNKLNIPLNVLNTLNLIKDF